MQVELDIPFRLPQAIYEYGSRSDGETHGVVLTKPHIVAMMLDLAGYTADRDLSGLRLLEPSCGRGAFVLEAVRRLMTSWSRFGREARTLERCIVACDIDPEHVSATRDAAWMLLRDAGVDAGEARGIVDSWIRQDDFLLAPLAPDFDVIVGNPPYVRIEQIAGTLIAEYRRRYSALFDRADLYVAFIQRSLGLLGPEGKLSLICADRWISNKYGSRLRRIIAEGYRLHCYIDLHGASPFESEVIAYPSVFVVSRGRTGTVPVFSLSSGSRAECSDVVRSMRGEVAVESKVPAVTYPAWFTGDEPWVLGSPRHLELLRALEARFRPIEETARIGIGVATGADRIYVVNGGADIERDRLLPLVMRSDIRGGKIQNAAHFVINTFVDGGGVIALDEFPRLRSHLEAQLAEVMSRHVAKKNAKAWFRTIDRVYPDLVHRPKLLIPDIAGANEVIFDPGHYYPHHNLYYVTSDEWDIEVLGGLLSSRVALFFIWSYAVKMRGKYLRFQAQYLRRIRLPDPGQFPKALGARIKDAFRERAFPELDRLALEAWNIEELPPFPFVDTRK